MDEEIEAMAAVATAIDKLDEGARGRVLRWAGDKWGVSMAGSAKKTRERAPLDSADEADSPTVFSSFVDLYDAVDPKTDVDRALTGAYWFQVLQRQDSWTAQPVNNLLKDVGHGATNITTALTGAQNQKPALVRQMNKSGRSRQARKTYKLTTSGIASLRKKLGSGGGDEDDAEVE